MSKIRGQGPIYIADRLREKATIRAIAVELGRRADKPWPLSPPPI
ncbi:hypothetical protein [Streptomyces flaveus]